MLPSDPILMMIGVDPEKIAPGFTSSLHQMPPDSIPHLRNVMFHDWCLACKLENPWGSSAHVDMEAWKEDRPS